MGFQLAMPIRYAAALVLSGVVPIKPFYGVALSTAAKTPSLITGLANRGPTGDSRLANIIGLNSTGNDSYYYAYPVSFGQANFMEVNSSGAIIGLGYGGWDGAQGDPINLYGPVIVSNVVADGQPAQDFYLYESDWPTLGLSYWQVS
jgi:hypothetical protein